MYKKGDIILSKISIYNIKKNKEYIVDENVYDCKFLTIKGDVYLYSYDFFYNIKEYRKEKMNKLKK